MISTYFIIGLLISCRRAMTFMWMTYASYLYISLLISCISRNTNEGTTLEFYYRYIKISITWVTSWSEFKYVGMMHRLLTL